MRVYGFKFPEMPRRTALHEAEEWYQNLLADRLGMPYTHIQRNNFGQYDMAVHYLTSVLEEAKAIEKVAIFNIDHMGQILFSGKDACSLLNRVLPADIENMKIGSCKYTLLLNENGTVRDDMIVMKRTDNCFILVINAGFDITEKGYAVGFEVDLISDADFIMQYKYEDEEVYVENISDRLVKLDVQGIYSYKVITEIFGNDVLKNRTNPEKNMVYFSFNEVIIRETDGILPFDISEQDEAFAKDDSFIDEDTYFFSRTGYTNRWGWEIYIPIKHAEKRFKQIVLKALDYGGLLVGLGGRDENRISAGNVGLPLMGSEYDEFHTPSNAPLIDSAVDWNKSEFVGREALLKDKENKNDKRLVIIIAEGNIVNCGVYLDGKRIGSVTSCIISPNVSHEKRLYIGSTRKNVNEANGTAAIALAWLYNSPYKKDENGLDILIENDLHIKIKVELFREKEIEELQENGTESYSIKKSDNFSTESGTSDPDQLQLTTQYQTLRGTQSEEILPPVKKEKVPTGKAILGYISSDGVNPATSAKALKSII
ncbi:MAG: aminomethyl transferase family protein [Candidatus Cloacimonetes bacterium]|nr:aminomethyl transferase family protein [Candidatus Cloacimonadota bacterium]